MGTSRTSRSSLWWWWWVVVVVMVVRMSMMVEGAAWCVAKTTVSQTALQTALDYACGAGADCVPIQSSGLCYLPNTVLSHASYAFNSYFQRKAQAPGSCDFSGTANIATTDPSFGSCVYPSSSSNAGGQPTPPVTLTPPNLDPTSPLTPGGLFPPPTGDLNPPFAPDSPNSDASASLLLTSTSIIFLYSFIPLLAILFQTI